MAQAIATSFLRLICDKLGNKVMNEFGMLLGVEKELKKLENTLSVIQDVLEDAEQQQVKERALKNWLRKLKDLAYEMDDLLDEVAAKALKRKAKEKVGIKEMVRNFPLMPNSLLLRSKIGHRINDISKKLNEVAEERLKFHLRKGTKKNDKLDTVVREQTYSFVDEAEVYGRQEEQEQIIDFLISDSDNTDLGVIAIVGMGGLGKTTLAQLVYNDQRVRQYFQKLIWICVSVDFDTKKLSRSIIESVTGEVFKIEELDVMQRSLREKLQGQRFLLVLDDVWNEDNERWDRLRILLSKCAKGSKVIVSTRSKRVASIMGTVAPHILSGLSEDDCWLLFKRRAFELGSGKHYLGLEEIGKEIVKKCGGVPLAAKVLGSLLRFKRSESEWLAVRDNEIWRSGEVDNIFAALMLSYDHLPSHLKQCFAHCSIFLKGKNIRIETLVRMWIAEGFVWSYDGKMNLEDLGKGYVDELLSRSLFQTSKTCRDGAVREVKMHDLVYDLARFISDGEYSVIQAGASRDLCNLSRYLGFHYDGQTSPIDIILHHGSRLRALYADVSENLFPYVSTPLIIDDKEFIDALFSGMKVLRSVHLRGFPMRSVPYSLNKLTHMRYLNLSFTRIEELPPCISSLSNLLILELSACESLKTLPESIGGLINLLTIDLHGCRRLGSLPSSIGRLKNLQSLDVSFTSIECLPESIVTLIKLQTLGLRRCYWLRKLPDHMKELKSLVHLDIRQCDQLAFMPSEMGELNQLQTLPLYVLSVDKMHGRLAELNVLKLTGELCIKNLGNVRSVTEAKEANLRGKQGLRSLSLEWSFSPFNQSNYIPTDVNGAIKLLMTLFETIAATETKDDICLKEQVFTSLEPPENLEDLQIECYTGSKLPEWMMELQFPNLCKLKLEDFIRCEKLPSLGHLTNLKFLKFAMFPSVLHLPALGQLPFLKVLNLGFLPAVKCLGSEFYGGNVAFLALEELELELLLNLEEWSNLGEDQQFLPNLSKLSFCGCPNLKSLPSVFDSVKELTMCIDDDLLLSYFEIGAFRNLKSLSLSYFSEDSEQLSKQFPEVLAQRLDTLDSHSFFSSCPGTP